ncbi:MAG TPA: NmrA family NAD(P)-binding protein [Hymenobacter sp.]|jgi:uncharacterized protein YbjT (DUF2867 family)
MSAHPLKVLVYGATGSQQAPVVHQLLAAGHQPYALTHSPDKAESLQQAGARVVLADLANAEQLRQASAGMDAVSLLIPFALANPLDGVVYAKNAIDAAREAGVKLIVWNTTGFILPERIGNPAVDVRLDIADYLQQSGVPHITLQPSGYAENLLGPWTAPFVAQHDQVAYPTPADMPVGWVATQDVAALVVAALQRPELAGQSFRVSGRENLTGPELAERFSAGLGRPIRYHALPPAEFGAILDQVLGPGMGAGATAVYQNIHDTGQYPLMHTDMAPVLEKLPVQLTPIADWVKQYAAAFSPSKPHEA